LEEATATSGGRRDLAEAAIGVQEVAEFIMTSAKARRRVNGTEATHWPISALDPSMILLNAFVEILAVPVADIPTKLASNRTRVTVMPVGGELGRCDASHRFWLTADAMATF
jgi:hypothetical protein